MCGYCARGQGSGDDARSVLFPARDGLAKAVITYMVIAVQGRTARYLYRNRDRANAEHRSAIFPACSCSRAVSRDGQRVDSMSLSSGGNSNMCDGSAFEVDTRLTDLARSIPRAYAPDGARICRIRPGGKPQILVMPGPADPRQRIYPWRRHDIPPGCRRAETHRLYTKQSRRKVFIGIMKHDGCRADRISSRLHNEAQPLPAKAGLVFFRGPGRQCRTPRCSPGIFPDVQTNSGFQPPGFASESA